MDTANVATKGDIAEVKALIEKSETSLLTAFYKYAEASERRMFATETLGHTLSDPGGRYRNADARVGK
jgi:hypothetical protein